MPILKDSRVIKDIILPESGITLKLRDGLLVSDIEAVDREADDFKKTMILFSRLIADWDAENEAGQKLPINDETIKLIAIKDLNHIKDNLDFFKDFLVQAGIPNTK